MATNEFQTPINLTQLLGSSQTGITLLLCPVAPAAFQGAPEEEDPMVLERGAAEAVQGLHGAHQQGGAEGDRVVPQNQVDSAMHGLVKDGSWVLHVAEVLLVTGDNTSMLCYRLEGVHGVVLIQQPC